jgi:activator of 2-hydroxyglutaryl-CoA dehydratase
MAECMAKGNGYYIEEIAAILEVSMEDAKQFAYGMDDGDIDLGVCIQRKEQKRIRELIDSDNE